MLNVFRRNPRAATIEALYGAIVAQARLPVFYLDYGVPDTVNGRLDLLMLHLALTHRAAVAGRRGTKGSRPGLVRPFLPRHGRPPARAGSQRPESSEGMSAGWGRLFLAGTVLSSALQAGDMMALQAGLSRNVYQDAPDGAAARLSAYVKAAHAALAVQDPEALAQGGVTWPIRQRWIGPSDRNPRLRPKISI